jgi:hypothetical protein
MGINSLLQQDMQGSGLAGIDRLAGNAMYPQSQQVNTQFATPSQMPTSAEVVNAGYEPKVNAYTGMPVQNFNDGGNVENQQQLESSPEAVDYKAKIDQLYQGILGRSPDEGAKDWENLLLAGYDISEVGRQIGASSEAQKKALSGISEELKANDPNNFAGSVTQLYTSALGRTPDAESLEADINLLNRNPDAFAWLADTVTKSPEAQAYAEKSGVDLQKAYENNVVNYKHFTPTPKQGGLAGFANQYGYLAPFLLAGGALAAPYLAGAGAAGSAAGTAGAGAGGGFGLSAAGTGSTFGALSAAPSAGTFGGLSAGALGTGVPAGLMVPTTGALAAGAAGAGGAGGAAAQGLTLQNARDVYKYGKMGLNVLNAMSGGEQPSELANVPNAEGYSAFDPGIPTRGLPTLSAYEKTPWANLMPQISLSRISDFAPTRDMASGGITGIGHLGGYSDGGRLLKGPGDGMSDNIPASIADKQPARLADGEFVIPADVVSHLGNGSTDAGAKQLYLMMDKIRKARTGNAKQGKQINPNKFLPKG